MQLCVAEHGIGTQIPRESQVQPAPQLDGSEVGQLEVGTQTPLRVSQNPSEQSLFWVHFLPLGGLTQVERESQTKPEGQLPSLEQKPWFTQLPLSQSKPGGQSQSMVQVAPPIDQQLFRSHS